MSVRKQVFDYIKNNANTTIDDLRKAFTNAKERTLVKYLSDFRNEYQAKKSGATTRKKRKTEKASKSSKRQQVFDYLSQNLNVKLEELKNAFPDVNKGTISDYYYRWKRGAGATKKKITAKGESLKSKVFSYLNENPEATAAKLKKAFKDAKVGTLQNLRAQWRKLRKPEESGSDMELIKALKKTISAQEKAIEAMQKTIDVMNQETGSGSFDELEGLSLEKIKKVAATYLRGLRELPETLKRK